MNHSKITSNPKVYFTSKKIKKEPPQKKHYETQSKQEKYDLIMKIRKAVDQDFVNENWHQEIRNMKPPQYQQLLRYLYPNIEHDKIPSVWKKTKRMLANLGKSDYRGNALFGNQREKTELKEHIEWVIQNRMRTRCFEELREHVLPKIREMFERNGREFSDRVFKKHFWSYFLKDAENQNVKVLWKKLPRTKPGNVQKGASATNEDSNADLEIEIKFDPELGQDQEENFDDENCVENPHEEERRVQEEQEEDPDRFIQSYSEMRSQVFKLGEEMEGLEGFLPIENFFEMDDLIYEEFLPRKTWDFDELDFSFDEGSFGQFLKEI